MPRFPPRFNPLHHVLRDLLNFERHVYLFALIQSEGDGKRFEGRFLFDGDTMLGQALTVVD